MITAGCVCLLPFVFDRNITMRIISIMLFTFFIPLSTFGRLNGEECNTLGFSNSMEPIENVSQFYISGGDFESTGKNACPLNKYPITIETPLTLKQKCSLFNDFKKIENMSFDKYGEYFQKYFNPDVEPQDIGKFLMKFLLERIKSIQVGPVSGALASNLGLASRLKSVKENYDYGTIILTEDYFKEPWMKRIGTLIHEARHSDEDKSILNDNHTVAHDHKGHVQCRSVSTDPNKTYSIVEHIGCDKNLSGPYGYETIFYGNLLNNCTNCYGKNKELRVYQTKQAYNHSIGNILGVPAYDIE
ncbi:MAG: hypothetical protein CME61_06135 [Halobacteriovoraceae bacterium]|nr:hypothetical protein [Halobacteriovoraceae bacterium]